MKPLISCLAVCLLFLFLGCKSDTQPEFENTVAMVEIQPPGGTIDPATQVSMEVATPEAEIHYTLDGSEPTMNSPRYTAPFTLPGIGRKVVKARAFKPEWNPGQVSTAVCFIPHIQPEMVLVQGGSFFNGITQTTVGSLYFDKTEVTQAEYYAVMQSTPEPLKQNVYPVYYVSWLKAVEYCNRRSLLDGLTPCLQLCRLWHESG